MSCRLFKSSPGSLDDTNNSDHFMNSTSKLIFNSLTDFHWNGEELIYEQKLEKETDPKWIVLLLEEAK